MSQLQFTGAIVMGDGPVRVVLTNRGPEEFPPTVYTYLALNPQGDMVPYRMELWASQDTTPEDIKSMFKDAQGLWRAVCWGCFGEPLRNPAGKVVLEPVAKTWDKPKRRASGSRLQLDGCPVPVLNVPQLPQGPGLFETPVSLELWVNLERDWRQLPELVAEASEAWKQKQEATGAKVSGQTPEASIPC